MHKLNHNPRLPFSKIFFLFLIVALLPSCFVYRDIKIIQNDVKSIDARLKKTEGAPEEIQQLLLNIKDELKKIDKQIITIKEIPLLIANLADLKLNLDELREALRTINGKMEEYNHNSDLLGKQIKQLDERIIQLTALSTIKKEQEEAFTAMEKRLTLINEKISTLPEEYRTNIEQEAKKSADNLNILNLRINTLEQKINEIFNLFKTKIIEDMEKKRVFPEKKEPEQKSEIKPEKKVNPSAGSSELNSAELYLTAYNFYSGKKFDQAIEGFKNYIQKYPQTDLTDNAQYWIGEIFYVQKEYRKAAEELERLIKDYPQSDKILEAKEKLSLITKEGN